MAVQRYRFVTDYRSGAGTWTKGQVVEIEPERAAWFNRDIPGCLVPDEPEPEPEPDDEPDERAIEEPPDDRMLKRPGRKRGA